MISLFISVIGVISVFGLGGLFAEFSLIRKAKIGRQKLKDYQDKKIFTARVKITCMRGGRFMTEFRTIEMIEGTTKEIEKEHKVK